MCPWPPPSLISIGGLVSIDQFDVTVSLAPLTARGQECESIPSRFRIVFPKTILPQFDE